MAKATTTIHQQALSINDLRAEAMGNVEAALVDNQDGVTEFVALLGALQQKGVLEMATSLLQQGEEVLSLVVEHANQPAAVGGIKSVIALAQGLSKIDAQALGHVFAGVAYASEQWRLGSEPNKVGMGTVWKSLRDPDVSRGLAAVLALLKGIGQSVNESTSPTTGPRRDVRG